jgi:hypothetical protein
MRVKKKKTQKKKERHHTYKKYSDVDEEGKNTPSLQKY